MASFRKLLLISAFVASTVAGPVLQRGQCARYCTDESDFTLNPGSSYTYDYETTTITTVQGSSQDKTQLQLTAQVDIEALSKCELALRLRGVSLKLSDPESPDYLVVLRGAREFARTIERSTLRFSFQNGQVEHVCPSENVPAWVTNIQKGVLSAFQTYTVKPDWTTRTMETDVLGKCTAEYHSLGRSWQGAHTIRKIKDLSSCTDRENVETYLQGTPYSQDFQTKSLPVVTGNQECEQVISESFLQTSTCNEKLVFRPFSNRGNGVVTTVSQKLIFATTSERKFTGNDYRPTTELLLYSHAKQEVSSAKVEEETESALKKLCDASKDDISISVPRKFSTFVYKLKKLSFRSLKAFYQKTETICPDNSKARKFFMDAIPLVSTADSARFMFEMISKKAISDAESNFWLTSLSFITETSPEIIGTFTPLLDGRFDQAILGISALIRNYCQGKDCSNVPQVQTAINKLAENLGENCFSSEDKMVILSLKAIGNIGYLFGKENILEACYKNPQIRTETRLAAIEAFRRASCDISREDLKKTYANYNEDTEIRIAAYLGAMRCPSPIIIQAVKDVMMSEKINNVGSFVWTHLNALSKSKHPERQEFRDILSNLYLMNKFASDARKFSSAHEAAFFLESIDSGIHVDTHLIFSTDSYLPRTAMFNLTVDVFGKSCNLFQLDGRLEGLENVVESFFGPSGYFPQKNVARLLREKRSLDTNKLATIDSQFKEHYRSPQQPYGSLDVKVFGTSMWYNQYRHNDDGTPDINLLDIVTKLAEENEKEYSRSFMFLDTTFTIPMTSGMPLKIALNGTASVALKIGGKFDVKSFENVDILGHIEPSGAIEITGLLTVDAGQVARSGMRIISTMHSSSVMDGKLLVRRGEVVKAQLNMPRDRIEVFNLRSKLFLVHGMEEREKTTDKKEGTHLQSCTGRPISKVFGVKFCSELELPPYRANAPLQPLNGPARFNLYIEKTDPSLKSYNFDAQWKTELKNGGFIKHGMISLNTPESEVDRDVKMELYLNQADHTATLKVKTPVKRLGVNAKLVNGDSQKKLDFGVTVDDREYFSLQSELGITSERSADMFRSSLEVRIPERRLVAVTGSAELRHRQKYTAQLQIEDLTEKPILAKGTMEVGKKQRYDVELSLSSFPLDGTVKGYAQIGDSVSSRLTADYRILEGKMNKLNIIGKLRNLSANALSKYTGLLNIQASVLPEWNTEIQFETMKTTGHIENTISIALGDGARSRVHKIKMQEILRYEGSLTNNKVDASLSLVYPEKNVDYGVSMKHENTESSVNNQLQLQYATGKQLITDVQLKMNTGNLFSASGDLKLRYPGREAELQAEVSQASNKEYRGTASCQWQAGKRVGVVVHYKDKCEGSRWKYEVDGSLSLPQSGSMSFATIAGYHRGQFAASAEVVKGVDKYRAKVDYTAGNGLNHRMVGQVILKNDIYAMDAAVSNIKEKVSGSIELKMPNRRRATAKIEGRMGSTVKFASLEAFLDADRNPSKRILLNGEVRSLNEGYEGSVNLDILRRVVRGKFVTNLQGILMTSQWKTNNRFELEWSPTEKFAGALSANVLLDRSRQQVGSHIEFTTPYSGFENVTLGITHLFTNQQWESDLTTLLPYGNDVTLSSSGKYSFGRSGTSVATTAKIISSFKKFEELFFTISHEHNSRELTNKAELKWGVDKMIRYLVTGAKQSSAMKGTVQINSPFSYAKDISGEISHAYSGENYKTSGEFQWAPSKKLSFFSEGNHELSGRRRICTINFEGTSPFQGFERTGMKITYGNDGVSVNTDAELKWSNRKKITTSISMSKRNQLTNKHLEGKFTFTSPFRNYDNIQMSTSFEMNQNSYKVNVDTQLPHRSTASLNSQGKMNNWNDLEVNAVVIGHFPRYMENQRASIDIVHKLQNRKLRSTLDAAYGNERLTLLVIGLTEQGYNSRNLEFSATVNTPFRGFEELKADLAHNHRGYEYYSKLQVNKNKLSGSLTHKLNIRDALNFETTLEMTSTSTFPTAKISVMQTSNGHQLEHTSYILWDKNNKIHLNAQYLDKTFLKEFLVKFTSPFQSYRDMELKASLECQDWEHKGVISYVWDRRNKMTLGADIKNYRWESLNAQIEFTSPFRGYEFYSTVAKYDLTSRQKEAELSFLWDSANRKSIVAKGSYLYSNRVTNLALSLVTPFSDYEQVGLNVNFGNSVPEKSIFVSYERGWRKIMLKGKSVYRSDSAEISMEFNSPYEALREMSGLAKYEMSRSGMKGEVATQWNKDNKYKATANYLLSDTLLEGNVEVSTPFENYKKIVFKTSDSYTGNRLTSDTSLEWGRNKKVSLTGEFNRGRYTGDVMVKVQSSFRNYKEMAFNANYKIQSGIYEAEVKATMNQKDEYQGSFKGKYGGSHLAEVQMTLNSPISPFRNVQLLLTADSNPELYELLSTLKWEDKKSDIHLRLNRKSGHFYEAKMKLNTPFEEFREFSFDTSLRNDRNRFLDGRLIIATPFDALRNFDAYVEFKNDDAGCFVALKLNTPVENIRIEGKLTNSQFRPLLATIMIEALKIESSSGRYHESFRNFPGMSFQKVSSTINLDIIRWNNAKAKLSVDFPQYSHILDVAFQQDEETLKFEVKAKSPALSYGEAIASASANYKDLNRISTELSMQVFGKVNYLNGQFKFNPRNVEADVKIESPLLREKAVQLQAKFSRQRGDKSLNGEISVIVPSSNHQITAKYENRGNQILTNVKIDSKLLPFLTLETQAKYINSNGRDIEASFFVSTPTSNHQIVGSFKNYEGEKFAQVKIECPFSRYLNPFTVTGTMKHEGYSAVDVSLSVSTPGKEVRVAGNMKNEGWQNVEAFLTINTPFEVLKMVRLDGRFNNDRYQSIDSNFQIETSNSNFPSLGVSSKLSRTQGAEEMSLMLRLPVRNYRSVQLLSTLHYNSDYSSADSRVTFTLPRNKFVVYGQYGISKTRISGRGEIEVDNVKWSATGRLERSSEKKDVAITVSTPSSQTYTVGGAYGSSGNRRELAVTYSSPSNERYTFNSTMSYEGMGNIAFDFQAETPFYGYRNLQGSMQHQSSSNSVSSNVEYSKDGKRGFLKVYHRIQRDGFKGSVQLGCPHTKVRDVKLSYSRVKKHANIEDSIELDFNRAKQMKMEIILFGGKSSHFVLDVPVLPLTVTADTKIIENGREINFKSNYYTRVVSFRASQQGDDSQILQSAAFSWDERADKRVSYDFKLANTGVGQELLTRVDTPLRSLMLKGNFTNASRSRTGGVDFYWDASRSLEKHMAVGFVHADISTDQQTSHKVELVLEHPKLSRSLTQTNILSYGPSEFHLKSALHYSRDRNHHLEMELRAADQSRSRRESQYTAVFSLRHPVSRLDIKAAADVMDTRTESLAHLRLNSVDRYQVQNVREVKAKILKLRQEIEVLMRSNQNLMQVAGQISGRNGEYDFTLERKTNEVSDMTAQIKFSRRNRALDVSVLNTELDTGLKMSASFPKDSATLTISHINRGTEMTDASVFVGLEKTKILRSKLNWRPKLWKELRIVTGETLRSFIRLSRSQYASWSSSFAEEWSHRVSTISRAMSENLSPFVQDAKSGVLEIKQDLKAAGEAFGKMYSRNEFLMRDIVTEIENIKTFAKEAANGFMLGMEVLANITIEYLEDIYFTAYYAMLDLGEYIQKRHSEMIIKTTKFLKNAGKAVRDAAVVCASKIEAAVGRSYLKMQQWSDKMILKFDKWLRSYAPCIIDGYYYTKNAADKIRNSVNGFTSTVSNCFLSNPYFKALKNYATSVANTFKAFRDYEYAESAQAFLNRMYDMQLLDTVINHPSVDYLSGVAHSALRKSVEVYHNLGMDVVLSNAAESASNYLKTKAMEAAQEYLAEFYQSKAGAKYDFSPERGHVSLEFTLPAPRNSLMEVFEFKTYPEYQKMINVNKMAADYYEDFCIWDFYYKFTKYFTPSYWLPAFRAHALLSGNQHYITFDKLSYDFAGKCSYLLARDFVDGNFTVIVNYGTRDHMRKSLTVLVDGRKVNIGSDYKITLDDTKTELPIQIGKTVMIREGYNVRVENERKGFSIVCNFVHNYCSVSLSGFYFGRTAGLFGTFNYEPSLDMMSPSRYVMEDVESFTKSWEVGQAVCTTSDNFATLHSNDYRVQNKCKSLFEKSTSEYRACFKQVNPAAYLRMCISDLSAAHENDHESAICESAAAYFVECKTEGVPLKMPKHCVKCEKQDGTYLKEGEAIQFPRDGTVTAADVVFLVEEKECNRDKVRYLSKLAQGIDENFRSKGYQDVRYRVVGFGGDQVHAEPHIHTMDGHEFGSLRSLESALNSLKYGDGPVNVLEAVRFAAALTYRPGTTKSFVLMKCSTCKSEEVKAEYGEMLRTLLDGDITLHLLMEQKYDTKVPNKNSKARRVIGVDKRFAYTLKDVKDSQRLGDGDLLAQLRIPKDVCIPLAFEVNGSSFDSQFLTETKKNANKKFMDVLAKLVVRSSSVGTTDWGMCCECIATEDGVGKSVCQRCVSAEMASMISADVSGIYSQIPSARLTRSQGRRHSI